MSTRLEESPVLVDSAVSTGSASRSPASPEVAPVIFDIKALNVYYRDFHAVADTDLDIHQNEITALIGPSRRSMRSM